MLKRTIIILAMMFLASANPLTAQSLAAGTPLVLTFDSVLKMALERNIDAVVAQERLEQALSRIGQTRSSLIPQLNAVASESRQTKNLSTVGLASAGGVVGPFNVFDARVKITQTIFDLSTIQRLRSAKASYTLSKAEAKQTREDVLALVAVLFIEAKRSEESIDLFATLVSRDEKNLAIEKKKFEIGSGADLKVKEAEAHLSESTTLLEKAKRQTVESRLDLLVALGLPVEQAVSFDWGRNPENLFAGLTAQGEVAIADHPQVVVARDALAVSQANQSAEKAGYFPKLALAGDYGLSADKPQDAPPTYTFGLQATVPIFEGGNRQARIKEATSQVNESQAKLDDMERQVKGTFLTNQELVAEAAALLKQRQAELLAAEKNLELARIRVENGTASELDLAAFEAQKALSFDQKEEALSTLLTARVNLAHAQGKVENIFLAQQKE